MTNSEILDGLGRSSAVMGDLIDRIPAGQWAAPTPCTQWSVRDVVNHLVGMNLVFVAMLEESPMPERGTDILGADPAEAYRRSAAALQAAAARPGVLERSQATAMGAATGAERMQWRIADLLAHGWDLAQATGIVIELPDDLAEQSLAFVRASLPNQSRGGRFADPQPIADDAPAIDRLAAFTGRPVPAKIE
ncbi:MAG TPA: TIGR03086 family metal-binding protein [Kineosporiaceae bacterium]|nr:TIGR03086 family metal-binding protein [Kineosporiaceae bacterium]